MQAPPGVLRPSTHHTGITAPTQDSGEMQRRCGSCGLLPISKASLIGAIVTGRVLGAMPWLALTR